MATYYLIPATKDSFQQPVINFINSDPISPNKGDRYIIAAPASGNFTGKENQIAWFNGTEWLYLIPSTGWMVYSLTNSEYYVYTGTQWESFQNLINIDEKVKADVNDPSSGYLTDKVDNTTIEVDQVNHQLKVKLINATHLDQSDTYDFATNNGVILVADPQNDYEAVNLRTLVEKLSAYSKSLDWIESVLDIQTDATTDPGISPNDGDRYIITDPINLHVNFGTITGLEANDVVQYDLAQGKFIVDYDVSAIPTSTGAHTYVESLGRNYIYDGTQWVDGGSTNNHNSLAGLQGGQTGEYYHLTQTQFNLLTQGLDASSIHNHDSVYLKLPIFDVDLGAIIMNF